MQQTQKLILQYSCIYFA